MLPPWLPSYSYTHTNTHTHTHTLNYPPYAVFWVFAEYDSKDEVWVHIKIFTIANNKAFKVFKTGWKFEGPAEQSCLFYTICKYHGQLFYVLTSFSVRLTAWPKFPQEWCLVSISWFLWILRAMITDVSDLRHTHTRDFNQNTNSKEVELPSTSDEVWWLVQNKYYDLDRSVSIITTQQ